MTAQTPAERRLDRDGPVPLDELLSGLPPALDVTDHLDEIRAGRRLVILDDDPTGTQTIADLPVLTRWSVDDVRWALHQDSAGFFVLTNTRSLSAPDAAERNREVVRALAEAARLEGDAAYVIASRSDSTLRGYFPLETDVLAEELAHTGQSVDGVVVCPAFIEPGRITIDSVHWMRTADGMIPVGRSEFARDRSFGYHHSDLRDWVEEKTQGRVPAAAVATITIDDIRTGGPDRVQTILAGLSGGRPVVVDAVADADLQVVALALVRAEAAGACFLYRCGPSFVRARSGQQAMAAIDATRLRRILASATAATMSSPGDDSRPTAAHGLVVVGSHVGLTTRQLDGLRASSPVVEVELHVPTLLDPGRRADHIRGVAAQATDLLRDNDSDADVVVRTSRELVPGTDAHHSLDIARTVSASLVETVREVVAVLRPAFVLAKGGITSSDTATEGLGVRRAWSRGTMLPGIVSLWEPVSGPAQGIPYIVFPGNVGDDAALADVVATLRSV